MGEGGGWRESDRGRVGGRGREGWRERVIEGGRREGEERE